MVQWNSDTPSYLSGYDPLTKKTIQEAYVFATTGQAVNVNATTRIGRGLSVVPTGGIRGIKAQIRMLWFAADGSNISTANRANWFRGVTVFLARAADVPGENPTPQTIVDNAYSIKRLLNTNWNNSGFVYNIEWWDTELTPGTKYWIVAVPVIADRRTDPSKANDKPPQGYTVNGIARGLSFWTDRTARAPVITSPSDGAVVDPGAVFTVSVQPNDGDTMSPDDATRYNRDLAGLIVEYAAPPSPTNPEPQWSVLPYTLANGSRGAGSFAYRTNTPSPLYEPKMINDLGFPVKAGADTPPASHAGLPAGTWMLRARTVGFGNPFPETNGVGGSDIPNGPWTPNGNPMSPWSDSVKVTVPSRVPVPLALSPTRGRAMAVNKPLTLAWKYRNLNIPALPQTFRRVQMRKPTEANWTTIDESFSADPFHTLGPAVAPVPFYRAYLGTTNTNWTGIAAGAGTVTPTVVDNHVTMQRGGTVWPDATKTGPVVISRGSIPITDRSTRVEIKGRRRMGENPVPGQVYSVQASFRNGGTIVPSYMESQVGAENTWASTYENFTLVYWVAPGFTSVRIEMNGQDGLPAELGITSIRADAPGSGYVVEESTEYEWRVQVADSGGELSGFSQPARFWVVPAANSGEGVPVPTETLAGATLGCGTHRAFIYRRGGKQWVGEITGLSSVEWGRVRDDISTATINVENWGIDCGNLLARLHPWAYELVIYRDNGYGSTRVWEGPITLLTYEQTSVKIQAKDIMGYLYRRIIRQEMNDSKSGRSVVTRATEIVQNAFAPDDPNILSYLNPYTRDDDPKQYRSTPEYSRMAFEEIDDMASNSGLDYTALGRSIILWGTRHRIGTLPEFTDAYFSSPPVVSVYGMNMANRYVVSDGNGIWGGASRGLDPVSGNNEFYGLVEMLSSTWASDEEPIEGVFTDEQRQKVIKSFEESSEHSIKDRYPAPVVVRVPDNTTLNPSTPVSIQQLVPGVVIPLRATSTLREVVGSQKLDSVTVTETEGVETINVIMSPFNRDDAMAEETE